MRKIESQMNQAIQSGKNWAGSNTTVSHDDGVAFVYLHGNKICEIGEDSMKLFDGGWQSNTTKSRLNAILDRFGNGERVFAQAFEWYLGSTSVPFYSGMEV